MKYDYLIVGAGLYGATFAHLAAKEGKRCLVIDRRLHTGGNVYCEQTEGINVHKYGAHIFHTNNKTVWDFVNEIVPFNRYTNSPIANYKGRLFNLPFNMNTFYQLWGVTTPQEAIKKVEEARIKPAGDTPQNLEEQALSLVGKDIYEILIKDYTEKQWGRPCTELPAFIIKRLPLRFSFDNNYFNAKYQGIPVGGYNKLIDGLLSSDSGLIDVITGIDVNFNQTNSANISISQDESITSHCKKSLNPAEIQLQSVLAEISEEFCFHQSVNGNDVDFINYQKHLAIELVQDSQSTNDAQFEDNQRISALKNQGFTILRLKEKEILENKENVEKKIQLALQLSSQTPLRNGFHNICSKMLYTGPIDEYFNYNLGRLDWRTVSFKTKTLDVPNYQGNAVVNYTDHEHPYTRIIEHKHFEMFGDEVYNSPKTVISEEYSTEYKTGMEPYYPVNDLKNNTLAEKYKNLATKEENVLFGGRLAEYKYYDMDKIIEQVLSIF